MKEAMYFQLLFYLTFCIHLAYFHQESTFNKTIPIVITTWQFVNATEKAWDTIYNKKGTALDAIEFGCSICEDQQCDGTVGYGGSPDENGETTLDAMIMDGTTMNIGAVAALRRIKSAISVARQVLDHTSHSMLAGDQATAFAKSLGFKEESLITPHSTTIWQKWKDNKCQPNFWTNVSPNPTSTCGPYKPNNRHFGISNRHVYGFDSKNHDTIGMVAIDSKNQIAAGTSTNGANHKIAGRVGDSPIPGAGAYADGEVGGAAATGDGDVMLRFLPSFLAVEQMRNGASPTAAAETAIKRITRKYSSFVGGIVAVKTNGEYGAACHGLEKFHFTVSNILLGHPTVQAVSCV